jgi:hypothetical protein
MLRRPDGELMVNSAVHDVLAITGLVDIAASPLPDPRDRRPTCKNSGGRVDMAYGTPELAGAGAFRRYAQEDSRGSTTSSS